MKFLDYVLSAVMITSLLVGIVIQWVGVGAESDPWAYMKPVSPSMSRPPPSVSEPWAGGS